MRALGLLGDFYHGAEGMRRLFTTAGGTLDWTVVGPGDFAWATLADYPIVVVGAENRTDPPNSPAVWMTSEHEQALVHYVEQGGNLLGFHCGLASYPLEGRYTALVGGAFQFHPVAHPRFRFVPRPEAHPILDGIEAFELTDEMYFVWRDAATTESLAVLESQEYGSSSALWCGLRGKGRIVGLTPGHRPEVLEHPSLIRLVSNALAWLQDRGTL